eukprot:TRINITY_DN17112_c0_g2_i1.p1 TRINITY_DN17112_c0_g2~~TRINITY_DN17112_c0_g2_i1.p1  ORF type:complete len:829 (-),score=152.91 TRINITY_DN17112_c0_g2_i1:96-2582(-)
MAQARQGRRKGSSIMRLSRPCQERRFCGILPLFTPRELDLELIFFRRIFSSICGRYGNSKHEVAAGVLRRSAARLLRVLNVRNECLETLRQDAEQHGSVSWLEFAGCFHEAEMKVKLSFVERLFFALEDPATSILGFALSLFVTTLIFFSCMSSVIGTLPQMQQRVPGCRECEPRILPWLRWLELICIGVFILEYFVRAFVWTFSRSELLDLEQILVIVMSKDGNPSITRLRRLWNFFKMPMNLVDFMVIVPPILETLVGLVVSNFSVLRVLRLTRLLRVIKLGRYFETLEVIVRVTERSTRALYVLLFYLSLAIVFSSTAMYLAEGGVWNASVGEYMLVTEDGTEIPSQFQSIPHTFWWCIVTLTTVGYGDVKPETGVGKLVACCTMLCGVLVLAMPISIVSMNFSQVWAERLEELKIAAETEEVDRHSVSQAIQGIERRGRAVIQLFAAGNNQLLGEAWLGGLPIDSRAPSSREQWLQLRPASEKSSEAEAPGVGKVHVGFAWKPKVDDYGDYNGGSLELRITRTEVFARRPSSGGYYVALRCWPRTDRTLSEEGRTKVISGTVYPVWDEVFSFVYERPPPSGSPTATFQPGDPPTASPCSLRSLGQCAKLSYVEATDSLDTEGGGMGALRVRIIAVHGLWSSDERELNNDIYINVGLRLGSVEKRTSNALRSFRSAWHEGNEFNLPFDRADPVLKLDVQEQLRCCSARKLDIDESSSSTSSNADRPLASASLDLQDVTAGQLINRRVPLHGRRSGDLEIEMFVDGPPLQQQQQQEDPCSVAALRDAVTATNLELQQVSGAVRELRELVRRLERQQAFRDGFPAVT